MFKAYPKVSFSVVILVLIGLTLILTACGSTDHGGYASPDEGCSAQGTGVTIAQGPIIERDEIEYLCTNGKTIEAQRNHVKGPDAKNHSNAWTVDEDSLTCADGTEIGKGDDTRDNYGDRESCNDHGGLMGAEKKPAP